MKFILVFLFSAHFLTSQNINVNNDFFYKKIRALDLLGDIDINSSQTVKPIDYNVLITKSKYEDINFDNFLYKNKNETILIKSLGLDYFVEQNTHHPYNRNNGTMIPSKGYQHIISPGFFIKVGPLEIKLKPEHFFSENKEYEGFWDGHYPEIWAKRYRLWNRLDIPERFGNNIHSRFEIGQSSLKLNFKKLSIGISNENLWWGPSIRNSIMLSNHAQGFKHITFNTNQPLNTFVGSFEFQFITGRLENSGFTPPRTDYEYAGTKLYIPKINQRGWTDDWRYLQGYVVSYSPKWINGLSIGFVRWVQMYSALVKGLYPWLEGKPSYFPVFSNLFRKNDQYENYEAQTDQAAGVFFRWVWKDSNAEIYAEFHHNDAKVNLRDLLLDSDHSRAATVGIQKIFKVGNLNYLFGWEWTQMEQSASRILRNAGSWYEHGWVYDGYTNKGEVLGSSIGPGSNSHYISLDRIFDSGSAGLSLEFVDQDNDFYHEAFASARDYRRYWKDINLHLKFNKELKNLIISSRIVYIRSLNYQWELDDFQTPYYHPGNDIDNFHLNLKLTYFPF